MEPTILQVRAYQDATGKPFAESLKALRLVRHPKMDHFSTNAIAAFGRLQERAAAAPVLIDQSSRLSKVGLFPKVGNRVRLKTPLKADFLDMQAVTFGKGSTFYVLGRSTNFNCFNLGDFGGAVQLSGIDADFLEVIYD